MNVLVIDDARVMRKIISNSINENYMGACRFFEARDGVEAMEMLLENHIDIAFVDWNMPNMDGLEFTRNVRDMENYSDLKMIMITSEAARYMVVEAVKAGVTDYIVKPVVGQKLWGKIERYFPPEQ